MLRRVKHLFFGDNDDSVLTEKQLHNEPITTNRRTRSQLAQAEEKVKSDDKAEKITASELARALLKQHKVKPTAQLSDVHKAGKRVMAIENLITPETPQKAESAVTPERRRSRRRYKRYDVSAKRRVINPLLELEDETPIELPLQVVELEEGSESLRELDAQIIGDLEKQLKESGDSEDEFVEAESQFRKEVEDVEEKGDVKEAAKEREVQEVEVSKMEIMDVTEVASWSMDLEVEEVESSKNSSFEKPGSVEEVGAVEEKKEKEKEKEKEEEEAPESTKKPETTSSPQKKQPEKSKAANDAAVDKPEVQNPQQSKELPKVNRSLLEERLKAAAKAPKNGPSSSPHKQTAAELPKVNKQLLKERLEKSSKGFGSPVAQKAPSGKLPKVNKALLKERLQQESSKEKNGTFGSPDQAQKSTKLPKVNRELLKERLENSKNAKFGSPGAKKANSKESPVVKKTLLNQRLRKLRKTRQLRRDSSGKWTTKEDSDSDVILLGEEVDVGSSQETPTQSSNVSNDPIDDASISESDQIDDSLDDDYIEKNEPSSAKKPKKAKISKDVDDHAATEVFETPARVSNRYPIAPALAPGRVIFGSPLLASSTIPPVSGTSHLSSRTSGAESRGTLPSLVRQAHTRPDSSPTLFVSADSSSSNRPYTAPSVSTSPYHRGLNRNRKKLLSLPQHLPSSIGGLNRNRKRLLSLPLPASYRQIHSSQTNSMASSQGKDKLMVPETSVVLPPGVVMESLLLDNDFAVRSSQEITVKKEIMSPKQPSTSQRPAPKPISKKMPQRPPPQTLPKKVGTLPTSVKPALAKQGQNKRVKLNPMYLKLTRPEAPPQTPPPKSLAQQLKERREQLEKSAEAQST